MGCLYSIPKKGEEDNIIINNSNKWHLGDELGQGSFGWVRKATCYNYSFNPDIIINSAVKILRRGSKNSEYMLEVDDNEYYIVNS